MPIVNPNIILGAVQQQRQGRASSLSDALTVQTQRERLASARLEREAREGAAADNQKLRDIFSSADPADPDSMETAIMRVSPETGLKLREGRNAARKSQYEADKAKIAVQAEEATRITQVLQGVTDEASFQAARAHLQKVAPDAAAELGDTYDPNVIRTHVTSGMKVSEYLRSVNDELTRQEAERTHRAGETETNRANVAKEGETKRSNQATEADRRRRTGIYENDLKFDRVETARHNMAQEVINAASGKVGSDASSRQDFEEYKLYVQQWDKQQAARAKAAGAELDDEGNPVGYDYQMPPAFEHWRKQLERGTRNVATLLPGDIQLPSSQAPLATAVTPAPARTPSLAHGTAPMTQPAAPPMAASHAPASRRRTDVQIDSIVTLGDGRRMRVTSIDPTTGKVQGVPVSGGR